MVTLLNCIERIPSVLKTVTERRKEAIKPLIDYLGNDLDRINEVIFVGSGTSNTSAMTSQPFFEKVSGLRTKVVFPSSITGEGHVYNPDALYLFTSQTGTSIMTRDLQKQLLEKGYLCVSLTESENTPLAKDSKAHVILNCGNEEYAMRTIGYAASVLTHMLIAMELGLVKGTLTADDYKMYVESVEKLPESHENIRNQAIPWFQKNKRLMMRSDCVIFTGSDSLYGVALEGAVKFWEMPQVISMGYELEEGLHGPNYGYTSRHCVVVLDDGGKDTKKAQALARYMKDVNQSGLIVGPHIIDENDLLIEPAAGEFGCIELSVVCQIMSYFLAEDGGRDLTVRSDRSVMNSYFKTHM